MSRSPRAVYRSDAGQTARGLGSGVSAHQPCPTSPTVTYLVPHCPQQIPHAPSLVFPILAQITREYFVCAGKPIFADDINRLGFQRDDWRFWRVEVEDLKAVGGVAQECQTFRGCPKEGMYEAIASLGSDALAKFEAYTHTSLPGPY